MEAGWVLVSLVVLLVGLGAVELLAHRRNLATIQHRIHVNGTRGKSSVTRLIAAGLRAGGITTCAKTTGTLARVILPDGRELPVFRPAGANVIEQLRIVATASAYGAEALVIECMAIQPELQSLSEDRFVRATIGVITNARPDHLDVMGPTDADVARALSGMIPSKGVVLTAETTHLEVLREAASDRGSEVIHVSTDDVAPEDLEGFAYTEHADNVALALRVCDRLGVEKDVALAGMRGATPDPGAMTVYDLDFFGRHIVFVNGFAANDPVSTRQIWELALARHPAKRRIAVFNCRADRPERSIQLGSEFGKWGEADQVVLMGTGTYLFARAAARAGYDTGKLMLVEGLRVDEIFERVVSLVGSSALVMGMGNVGGHGLELVQYFANRARIENAKAA